MIMGRQRWEGLDQMIFEKSAKMFIWSQRPKGALGWTDPSGPLCHWGPKQTTESPWECIRSWPLSHQGFVSWKQTAKGGWAEKFTPLLQRCRAREHSPSINSYPQCFCNPPETTFLETWRLADSSRKPSLIDGVTLDGISPHAQCSLLQSVCNHRQLLVNDPRMLPFHPHLQLLDYNPSGASTVVFKSFVKCSAPLRTRLSPWAASLHWPWSEPISLCLGSALPSKPWPKLPLSYVGCFLPWLGNRRLLDFC